MYLSYVQHAGIGHNYWGEKQKSESGVLIFTAVLSFWPFTQWWVRLFCAYCGCSGDSLSIRSSGVFLNGRNYPTLWECSGELVHPVPCCWSTESVIHCSSKVPDADERTDIWRRLGSTCTGLRSRCWRDLATWTSRKSWHCFWGENFFANRGRLARIGSASVIQHLTAKSRRRWLATKPRTNERQGKRTKMLRLYEIMWNIPLLLDKPVCSD